MALITDFHTHILPGIDDGSDNVEESVAMLQKLSEQGVGRVLLTPHFYPQRQTLDQFLEARNAAAKELARHPNLPKNLEIIMAAEVYLDNALMNFDAKQIQKLLIPGTNCILVEFPYNTPLSPSVLHRVSALIYNYNCTPILAHIERYLKRLSKDSLENLLEDGCKTQINLHGVGSLSWFKKRYIYKLIKNGYVDCCGTDCHNLSTRPPQYREPIQFLARSVGKNAARSIMYAETIF